MTEKEVSEKARAIALTRVAGAIQEAVTAIRIGVGTTDKFLATEIEGRLTNAVVALKKAYEGDL